MRIAIVERVRCQPKKCQQECFKYCPLVRTGVEAIVFDDDGKPIISEELCEGCGICVKRCPFHAISIIGLPEELKGHETHRFGPNGFVLYGLPIPAHGKITGIIGANGTGKSTAVKILAGMLIPNLGDSDAPDTVECEGAQGSADKWREVLKRFAGTELQGYFERLISHRVKAALKPQHIDAIPEFYEGEVKVLLEHFDERGIMENIVKTLEIGEMLHKPISELSGGELQRIAIAACIMRDSDIYFIDEITPYLDIYQRMRAAKAIREFLAHKTVVVVEHDLAILDMLADFVHIIYGEPARYGIVSLRKATNRGINEYLQGYLRAENVRIREKPIEFVAHPPRKAKNKEEDDVIAEFGDFCKKWDGFCLVAHLSGTVGDSGVGGDRGDRGDRGVRGVRGDGRGCVIRRNEIVGIVGRNATGKSTFLRIIAGEIKPTVGDVSMKAKISFKPQYIKRFDMRVGDLLRSLDAGDFERVEVLEPLEVKNLEDKNVKELSGGELQMLAIAACLCQSADIYALDEPSAHLDIEQKVRLVKVMRRFAEKKGVSMLIVDHDIYLIDILSDRLIVFGGVPSVRGEILGMFYMRDGMNLFLKELGITFRRDEKTMRPRVNKIGSSKDREQKERGEYYYL